MEGSVILAWSSDDYIGTNGQRIELAESVRENQCGSVENSACASLISAVNKNGTLILESVLSFIVLNSTTFRCEAVSLGTDATVTLILSESSYSVRVHCINHPNYFPSPNQQIKIMTK